MPTVNPFAPMFNAARADGNVSANEMERVIAYANRGGLTDQEKASLQASLDSRQNAGKISEPARKMLERFLAGKGGANKDASIEQLMEEAKRDGTISKAEVNQMIAAAQKFGINQSEKQKLRAAFESEWNKDSFDAGARERVGQFLSKKATPTPDGAEARRLMGVVGASGKVDLAEARKVAATLKKDGLTDGEKEAVRSALARIEKKLTPEAKKLFEALVR